METYTCKTGMCSVGKDIQERVCRLNFSFWYRRQNIQAVFSIYRQCTNICQAIMSENESAKAYLERRKALVGRLQGQHQVPGSTSKTLAQVKDICIQLWFKYKPWPGTKKLNRKGKSVADTCGQEGKRTQQWDIVQQGEAGGGRKKSPSEKILWTRTRKCSHGWKRQQEPVSLQW